MKNRSGIIISCIALIILLLGFLFYEIRSIPDVKWLQKFDYEDEEPLGLYVFKESVIRYFEGIDHKIVQNYRDTTATNGLYIYGQSSFSNMNIDTVLNIINKGNDVFIFSEFFPYDLNDTLDNYYTSQYQYSDSLSFNFTSESTAFDSNLVHVFTDEEFKIINNSYHLLDATYNYTDDVEIVNANDSLSLFASIPLDSGTLYYHILPELFFNQSYRQAHMFAYTERVLSHFDPDHIVFLKTLTKVERPPTEHPLQFIMSSPPLKAAYYMLVLGLLLYAIFGGKRKQKAIPITDKNENTSLEYVETVSQLFYQQNQHEKLVAHMKNIFYHKMEQKYFIKKDNPNYLDILTKKSKIPKADLQFILDRFRNLDENYSFQGDQLVNLNKRLEQIYAYINKNNNL